MKRGRKLGKQQIRCQCGRIAEKGQGGKCIYHAPGSAERRFAVLPKR